MDSRAEAPAEFLKAKTGSPAAGAIELPVQCRNKNDAIKTEFRS
jgi:hypothetical protein